MHEVSLIQDLLQMVLHSARENGIQKVSRVKLVVGESHGALPDALDFAFNVLTEGTICEGAVLDVEKRPLLLKCRECSAEFEPEGYFFTCPHCKATNAIPVSGRELYIDYYEGD